MSKDTRLSTAIHILLLLNHSKGERLQSDYIAGSVHTNPVVIRRLIGLLKSAGLVEVVSGKNGGCRLAKQPEHITILDVFKAVQNTSMFALSSNKPNEACPIGCAIKLCLNDFYSDVQRTLEDKLSNKTLEELYLENIT